MSNNVILRLNLRRRKITWKKRYDAFWRARILFIILSYCAFNYRKINEGWHDYKRGKI